MRPVGGPVGRWTRRYAHRVSAGKIERGLRRIRLARLGVVAAALAMTLAAAGMWGMSSTTAESLDPVLHEGAISDPLDVDWFVFFALAGERYVVELERVGLPAGRIEIWKPAVDEEEPRSVAGSSGREPRLTWMAPASGAWRVRVSGTGLTTGSYRLWIRSDDDCGRRGVEHGQTERVRRQRRADGTVMAGSLRRR